MSATHYTSPSPSKSSRSKPAISIPKASTSQYPASASDSGNSMDGKSPDGSAGTSGSLGTNGSMGANRSIRTNGSTGTNGSSSKSSDKSVNYVLTIVQQSGGGPEGGSNSLSRLPLNPPLIVKLDVYDSEGNVANIESTIPFLICHLTLLSASTSAPIQEDSRPSTAHPSAALDRAVRLSSSPASSSSSEDSSLTVLYGNIVSSAFTLSLAKDEKDQPVAGNYFVFPDVSVRFVKGSFRLGVRLFRLPGPGKTSSFQETLAYTVSEPFDIVSLDEYRAPRQTYMTAKVIDQGVHMYSH